MQKTKHSTCIHSGKRATHHHACNISWIIVLDVVYRSVVICDVDHQLGGPHGHYVPVLQPYGIQRFDLLTTRITHNIDSQIVVLL